MFEVARLRTKEKAILVGVKLPWLSRFALEESLQELAFLTETAGGEVLETIIQERQKLNPTFFIGKGKTDQIKSLSQRLGANLIIFDDDLTPAQVYNLEKNLDIKVIDRSWLILDIFTKRARSKEAKVQVELAQLKYLLPRLTRGWTHLSRQWGGIGTKGPGETQLEVDRRRVNRKIQELEKGLLKIDKERTVQRKRREDIFKVTLVGYTNVGKSTLFNQLTSSSVFVEEKLFATLDSTTRLLKISENGKLTEGLKIVITDTIGFIRKLPHHLVASFKSTLDEVRLADLLLHVVDISHPDFQQHIAKVNQVLSELDSLDKPTLMTYNKIDKLPQAYTLNLPSASHQESGRIFVSAMDNIGIGDLAEKITDFAKGDWAEASLYLDNGNSDLLPYVYKMGIVTESKFEKDGIRLRIRGKREKLQRIRRLNSGLKLKFLVS
ncbi:MAG: GTPase HflX [candidate division Zixibacteria bacterium]|nr:GTPase HflX [candidate division Zixibacteria bacterium]